MPVFFTSSATNDLERRGRPTWAACLLAGLTLLALAGCHEDDDAAAEDDDDLPPPITLSGTITYDRVPVTLANGLDYDNTVAMPVRGATVQVRSVDGDAVYYRAVSDENGDFTIQAPSNTAILIGALAELGDPGDPDTQVVNNADDDKPVYSVFVAHDTTGSDETGIEVNAPSGWGGSSYTGTRTAGPFAILDTIYSAKQLVRSADADVTFPFLRVNWSTANDVPLIGTSHYSPGDRELSILGKEEEDTDEYDDHVVAHEWGHYFEANFSRSDSLGGDHSVGDVLDETVAFGEGFGNALSGMITGSPNYYDSYLDGQGSTSLYLLLEDDRIADDAEFESTGYLKDGAWSEVSVQELLWDVFDSPADGNDVDGDGVELGFTPIYKVMTGAQKTFNGFTSIYSFMHFLRQQNPSAAAAIATVELNENIGDHDAFEQSATPRYTDIPADAVAVTEDVDGDPLQTYDVAGEITADNPGNKYYNRLMFRVTIPTDGDYRLRVTPDDAGGDVVLTIGGPESDVIDDTIGAETIDFPAEAGDVYLFSVGSLASSPYPDGVTPFSIRLGTPTTVPKPSPAALVAHAPSSNG